jgi:hypothetical protein
MFSGGNCANENVYRTAFNPVIPTEIKEPGGLYIIRGHDFFIAKGIEQLLRLGEMCFVPDAG